MALGALAVGSVTALAAASLTLDPTHGAASAAFTATYSVADPNGQCPNDGQAAAVFRWHAPNGTPVEIGRHDPPFPANCVVVVTLHPPAGTAAGDYVVEASAEFPPNQEDANVHRSAAYHVDQVAPTPTATSTPTPRPTATAVTTATPSAGPTPSTAASPSPSTEPATTAPAPSASVAPIGGASTTRPVDPGGPWPRFDADFGERMPWALLGGAGLGLLLTAGWWAVRSAGTAGWLPIALTALVGVAGVGPAAGGTFDLGPQVTFKVLSQRVTQGLDYDVADGAGVAYDLVAGKDTLVRVRLASDPGDATRPLASAACEVVQLTRVRSSSPFGSVDLGSVPATVGSVKGEVRELLPSTVVDPRLVPGPGAPARHWQVDCWIPGALVHPGGDYLFRLTTRGQGQKSQTQVLGTRTFQDAADLRVLVFRWLWPNTDLGNSEAHPWSFGNWGGTCTADKPGYTAAACIAKDTDPIYRPWDAGYTSAVTDMLGEMQRMWPLRAGVGSFDWAGDTPHDSSTPGMRVAFSSIAGCDRPLASVGGLRYVQCDGRVDAYFFQQLANVLLTAADAADGRHRDRFDIHVQVVPNSRESTGGQCKPPYVGAEIDKLPTRSAGFVIVQEIAHCLGWVAGGSPHAIVKDPVHSRNAAIPLAAGAPAVNLHTHADEGAPLSVLYPYFSDNDLTRVYLEGWEWNSIRTTMLARPHPDSSLNTYRLAAATTTAPALVIGGTVDAHDQVVVTRSQRLDGPGVQLTVPDLSSPYSLVFLDTGGTTLQVTPFALGEASSHSGPPDRLLALAARVPPGAARAEVRNGSSVLYGLGLGGTAPTVTGVQARLAGDHVALTWVGGGSGLSYNVYLEPGGGRAAQPIAIGLRGSTYDVSLDLLASGAHARFAVEASDGYNTGRGTSNEVSIPVSPPAIAITGPTSLDHLYSERPVNLGAIALAADGSAIGPGSISWKSNLDGDLGRGATITHRLRPGTHDITVTVTPASGPSASAGVRLTVASGAPAEVVVSVPPTSDISAPGTIDLGDCAAGHPVDLAVTAPAGVPWKSTADSHWLSATGTGSGPGKVTLRYDCTGLHAGATYTGRVLVAGTGQDLAVVAVSVHSGASGGTSGTPVLVLAAALAALVAGGAAVLLRRRRRLRPSPAV